MSESVKERARKAIYAAQASSHMRCGPTFPPRPDELVEALAAAGLLRDEDEQRLSNVLATEPGLTWSGRQITLTFRDHDAADSAYSAFCIMLARKPQPRYTMREVYRPGLSWQIEEGMRIVSAHRDRAHAERECARLNRGEE